MSHSHDCRDCGVSTTKKPGDYYMVKNEIWNSLTRDLHYKGMLCWRCIESRAKRKLTVKDLMPAPASYERHLQLLVQQRRYPVRRASLKQLSEYSKKACGFKAYRKWLVLNLKKPEVYKDPQLLRNLQDRLKRANEDFPSFLCAFPQKQ